VKLRKRKFEFNLFGHRVVIFISNFPHGYKRGDKLKKPDPNQVVLELDVR
jgi:hypothetical protein